MATKKRNSRILAAVHETASDLYRLGFIDEQKMQKYDALCSKPITEATRPDQAKGSGRARGEMK